MSSSAERVTLVPSAKNSTGYKCVSYHPDCSRPWFASAPNHGHLGSFSTKVAAATAYARHLGPVASLAAAEKESLSRAALKPMDLHEIKRHADAEGLTLVPSTTATSGYLGVTKHNDKSGSFKAELRDGGVRKRCLGVFPSAEEAALAYARHLGPAKSAESARHERAAAHTPTSEARVQQLASQEGLTLVRSSRPSGFQGVLYLAGRKDKPYKAQFGTHVHTVRLLGYFHTAPEAALAYARHLGPAASAAAAAGPTTITPGMSEDDAHAIAESEGLTLVPSHKSASGYLNVSRSSGGSKKPWKVQVRCRALGRRFKRDLGQFDSAPEAALAYARHLGKVASAQEAANSGLLATGKRSREDGDAEDGDEGEDDNEGEVAQCDENEGEAEDEHAEAESREDAVQLVEEDGGDVNEEEKVGVGHGWEKFDIRCAISLQRLTDPAKGDLCVHRARCNYVTLREYVGRSASSHCSTTRCPIAGCTARLLRTRSILRDDDLRAALQTLPSSAGPAIWLKGSQVLTKEPQVAKRLRAPRGALKIDVH
jgi:hypothetical protein